MSRGDVRSWIIALSGIICQRLTTGHDAYGDGVTVLSRMKNRRLVTAHGARAARGRAV